MKLGFIVMLAWSFFASANEFEILSLDKDIPIEKIGGKHFQGKDASRKFFSPEARDYWLEKHFDSHISKWDNMKRDIFYKKLITYEYDELARQYKFLTKKSYESFLDDVPKVKQKATKKNEAKPKPTVFPFEES